MNIVTLIDVLQRAASAGIDIYTVWKQANASIQYDGTVDKKAYDDLVSFCDKQIALLQQNAREASNQS